MYRIFDKKILFVAFGWTLYALLQIAQIVENTLSVDVGFGAVVAATWVAFSAAVLLWRKLWEKFPILNKWVFPDLNGIWEVELLSNWPRQSQMLDAAEAKTPPIDMRNCDKAFLASLPPYNFRVTIKQNWWAFEMHLWNPDDNTPIKESYATHVEPFKPKNELQLPGIIYVFEQTNKSTSSSDNDRFEGAAKLYYNFETKELEGVFWTNRMWERAMNTAGQIRLKRATSAPH